MGDMDSANSGSMQSSSTGGGCGGGGGGGGNDQEYDSRNNGESISALLNPISTFNNMSSSSHHPPLQLYSFTNNGSSSFDNHLPNFFDHPPTLPQSTSLPSPNFMLTHNHNHHHNHNNNDSGINQLEMVWPNKFIRPSLSTDDATSYTLTNNHLQQPSPQPPPPPPPPPQQLASSSGPSGSGRNPKKRSRASRRAPTTVLTTDTNNFRQMVQEFTGVPAPPFTAFSTRARFDLFNGLGLGSGSGQGHSPAAATTLHTTQPYLLRPFPQKIPPLHQPPFLANISNNNNNNNNSPNNNNTTTNISLCDQDFINTNPNLTSLLGQQTASSVSPLAAPPSNYRHISTTNTIAAAAAAGVGVNGTSDSIRGTSSKGEGMVDSWICSSSD